MSEKTKKTIVARHKKVAFYGVLSSDGIEKFLRMPKFTQLSQSKNPIEYNRQYVDEPFQETDITGYSPSISYAFDLHRNCEVQEDIVNITNNELIADDAVRNIVIVDLDEGTHVDTRTSLKWYGDETVTTAYSVTDDFYKHWKLSKNDVYGTAPAKKTKSVTLTIDGVTYQGTLTEK